VRRTETTGGAVSPPFSLFRFHFSNRDPLQNAVAGRARLCSRPRGIRRSRALSALADTRLGHLCSRVCLPVTSHYDM
jgi:hypothetical protein